MTQRKQRTPARASPLALTHPNAAGIDIGSASHFVAVPADRDDEPVREFRSFTGELERLADWLAECGIDTVAMESTGVYWIPLFELLDARGFTVLLVNARHVKNVSGRKSDVLDCQWLQQLMSDKHFASWLGLCPGTKITGGKVMSGKTARVANRAAQALKLAAAALRTSQSALGAYYRRLCARMDKPKAVTAAAHKLARLIYAMLTKGQEYTDRGQAYYEERYRQRVVANLNRRAQQLGLQVVPIAAQT